MAAEECRGVRVFGEKRALDYNRTLAFFEARSAGAAQNPLTATMYQDADLANRRDDAEKQTALPHLRLCPDDRVLDIGCGSGRWAQLIAPAVGAYVGIDFSAGLLNAARQRVGIASFQCMRADDIHPEALLLPPPFSLFVCSGILAYLNDIDVLRLFDTVSQSACPNGRIYIREPIAKSQRLTLDAYWSEELRSLYSAVYRTRSEYLDLFCGLRAFRLLSEGEPFPRELQNRTETEQRFFILERVSL
jgi:SAM-dependent methyltransferase